MPNLVALIQTVRSYGDPLENDVSCPTFQGCWMSSGLTRIDLVSTTSC